MVRNTSSAADMDAYCGRGAHHREHDVNLQMAIQLGAEFLSQSLCAVSVDDTPAFCSEATISNNAALPNTLVHPLCWSCIIASAMHLPG